MATKKDQLRDESIEALLALVDRLNISTDDPRFWPLLAIKLAREYAYEFRTIRQKEGAGRPPSIASDEAMKAGGTLLGLYEAEASRKPDISDTQIFKNLIHHDDFPKWFTQNRDGSKKPPPTTNTLKGYVKRAREQRSRISVYVNALLDGDLVTRVNNNFSGLYGPQSPMEAKRQALIRALLDTEKK